MYRVGIVGASGYTGAELIRLLHRHQDVKVTKVYSRGHEGKSLGEVFPAFFRSDLIFLDPETDELDDLDLLFLAVPHGVSSKYAKRFNGKIVDLGADFRFSHESLELYEATYNEPHYAPDLLKEATYGLPELFREEIKKSRIIGNPGCFPTSIILGVAPLISNGYDRSIVVSSLSGTSGAGKSLSEAQHFAHRDENFGPYRVGNHRHTPEIEETLSKISGRKHQVVFVPHLVPAIRGIVSTIYLDKTLSLADVKALYSDFYKNEFFIRIRPTGEGVENKNVYLSNFVDIQIYEDKHADKLIVVCAIDNLIKGASGQAIQNMNILLDLPETTGLTDYPVYP